MRLTTALTWLFAFPAIAVMAVLTSPARVAAAPAAAAAAPACAWGTEISAPPFPGR
jgi:hypothetical protein